MFRQKSIERLVFVVSSSIEEVILAMRSLVDDLDYSQYAATKQIASRAVDVDPSTSTEPGRLC